MREPTMNASNLLLFLAAAAVPLAASFSAGAASAPVRVSDPVSHENLSVYFIRGVSEPGPVPLSLQEAMARGVVTVRETGRVSELVIENTGGEAVFIQAGDIVKGGKQDRVLAVSLLVEPKSGAVPIGAFCVEQGRWAARGREDVGKFASADQAVPSRAMKLAVMAPAKPRAAPPQTSIAEPGRTIGASPGILAPQVQSRTIPGQGVVNNQSEVWRNVAETQAKLAAGLGARVAAPQSASSLQLSLENQKLTEVKAAYRSALLAAGEKDADIVGYALAINGRIVSADVYPSNGLFRKMWPKQLEAGAVEAIAEKAAARQAPPATDAVLGFLSSTDKGEASRSEIPGKLTREVREAKEAFAFETRAKSGTFVHRTYVAK
jgi:hypothetical protein